MAAVVPVANHGTGLANGGMDKCCCTAKIISIATLWITNAISCIFILGTSFGICFLLPRFNSISTIAKMTPQAMKIYSIFLNCILTAFPLCITIASSIIFNYSIKKGQRQDQEFDKIININKIILLAFNIISCLAVLSNCIINSILIGGFSKAFIDAIKIKVANTTTIIGMISNISLIILGSFPIVGGSLTGTLLISTADYDPDPIIPFPIPAGLPPAHHHPLLLPPPIPHVAPRRDVTGPNAQ